MNGPTGGADGSGRNGGPGGPGSPGGPGRPRWTPKPDWLRAPSASGDACDAMVALLRDLDLHTVCEEARCPNAGECFRSGTATFMILGGTCTRSCRFCAVSRGCPAPPDPDEPRRVAEAVRRLGLRHVVVTSVTRDDLPDGGASQFARTVDAIRSLARPEGPAPRVEVLIPDFRGDPDALGIVLAARPDVLNHNVETVPRLYPAVRPEADYARSLAVLERARQLNPEGWTKSGIMVGLGETPEEIETVFRDLRQVSCDMLTVGQYLAPTRTHLPVVEYVHPDQFERYRLLALAMGFRHVASSPRVRSSYHAGEISRLPPPAGPRGTGYPPDPAPG